MKELSIEQKAKAYDEALKVLHKYDVSNIMFTQDLKDEMFQEFSESKDEKIRKWLIDTIKQVPNDSIEWETIDKSSVLAWLEAQCEHANFRNAIQIGDKVTRNEDGVLVNLSQLKRVAKPAEKQGEQKPKIEYIYLKFREGDTIQKITGDEDIVTIAEVDTEAEEYRLTNSGFIPFKYEHLWYIVEQKPIPIFRVGETIIAKDGTNIIKEPFHIDKIEDDYYWDGENTILVCNQDEFELVEQKSADKVEPKFREGEWITNGDYTWQIVSVTDLDYILRSQDGNTVDDTISYVDESFHSFSIQDAKDGDVVVDKSDGTIGIFQSIGHHPDGGSYNDPSYCFLYCRYDDGFFYADFEHGNTIYSDDLIPATQGQRNQLKKAMTDAGYTFDFEKKELKKIEQKLVKVPKFKVGDFIQFNGVGHTRYTIKEVCGFSYYINSCNKRMDMSYTDANFELVKQKPAWSEEDEKILKDIITDVKFEGYNNDMQANSYKKINWLKSLKDRVQPQPHCEWCEEDESRMDNLCHFLEEYGNQYYGHLTLQGTISWLKSLRPQNTWKPSDEQIEALESATENCAYSEYQDFLRELIGQLKKLKS